MANIKLKNHYWETSGIYDKVEQKTQRAINAEIDTALAGKVSVAQGAGNAGKAMVVGQDGNLAPEDITIDVDPTLSQEGEAADAKATGDALADKADADDVEEALNDKADIIISSASGDIASFSDGADNLPVKDLTVSIDPVQDLHGYANPWPAGGGKNLLPMTVAGIKALNTVSAWDGNSTTIGNVTFTILTDESNNVTGIKTNGTANATIFFILATGLSYSGSHILSGGASNAGISLRKNNTSGDTVAYSGGSDSSFTSSETLIALVRVGNGDSVSNVTVYPMIRLSSVSDATFAPYSNICPISGWTGCNVTRTGKNLLDVSSYQTVTSNGVTFTNNGDGTITVSGKATNTTFAVFGSVSKAGTYILNGCPSGGGSGSYQMDIRDSGASPISGSADGGNGSSAVEVPAGYRVFCRIANGYEFTSAKKFYPMIRLSTESDATFAPYAGTTLPISWQSSAGTVYGGTLDVTSGVLTVDRAMYIFTSGSSWSALGNTWACEDLDSLIKPNVNNSTKANIVSTIFAVDTPNNVWNGVKNGSITVAQALDSRKIRIYLSTLVGVTASDVASFMAGSAIVYELATPLEYTLTAQQLTTLLGENNIWADTGDILSVEYRADTGLYINGKLVEIDTLRAAIAPIENGTTASQAYAQGKYFFHNGDFCKAKAAIASGATFTLNTNYEVTTVAAELFSALNS